MYTPHYCETVTADAGSPGDYYPRLFTNNGLKIPTILTTSEKLSTGVDACNIRSVVFYRNARSIKDVQKYSALQDYDVFDVMLDLAYNVHPVTRAVRVERLAMAHAETSEQRRRFAERRSCLRTTYGTAYGS